MAGLFHIELVVVVVAIAFVVVVMPVELGLFQQPEEQQPAQQRQEQRMRVAATLEGLGQHMQHRRAQQHAHRQADQVLDQAPQHAHGQRRGNGHRQQAAGQGGNNDVEQGHAAVERVPDGQSRSGYQRRLAGAASKA